jgi:hypothetical protein
LLWVGESVSDVGTAVTTVVLPLVAVVSLRARALEVGALAAAQWLPWLLVGLPAGAWVDRSRCRRIMVTCDVVRALVVGSVPLAAGLHMLMIGQLFGVAFIIGLATVFFQVAYHSYLPSLLDRADLAEGNAKLQGSESVAQVAGPGFGGLLAQLFQAPFALIADAVSYIVSAAALLAISTREPTPAAAPRRGLRREIAEGLRYVAADPLLRVLTVAPGLANFFFTGVEVLYVLMTFRQAYWPPAILGRTTATMRFVLYGTIPLGALTGGLLADLLGSRSALWVLLAGNLTPGFVLAASPLRAIRDLPATPPTDSIQDQRAAALDET